MTDKLAQIIGGTRLDKTYIGSPGQCNACGSMIKQDESMTLYMSNRNYREDEDTWRLSRSYCAGCKRHEIQFPCKGVSEAIVKAKLDGAACLRRVQLVDRSSEDDGTPWDPENMWLLLVKIPIDDVLGGVGFAGVAFGPEDVYEMLRNVDVDPKELVNASGELMVDDDELTEVRESVESALMDTDGHPAAGSALF